MLWWIVNVYVLNLQIRSMLCCNLCSLVILGYSCFLTEVPQKLQILQAGLALPLSSCGWDDGILPGSIHVYPGHVRVAPSTAGPG